ncbi:hypothetical protein I3842_03G078300 [Carya illinoinensis]|uniref:Uncharacterized protein n=1 Tax=Carya illinoinensis TaxID=32201 RepID=A0A922FIB6_CARIL|nr:hypothetical protein I3842_03G078300 [Carya illinoinensis]
MQSPYSVFTKLVPKEAHGKVQFMLAKTKEHKLAKLVFGCFVKPGTTFIDDWRILLRPHR